MATQANPGSTIGEWTASRLIKFIKQMFETDPPTLIPRAQIQDLTVTKLININDQIKFIRDPNFHNIGATGEPVFTNAWVNTGGGFNVAGYWKDAFELVHLRGRISTGTVGTSAFTLPVGFRPRATEVFSVLSNATIGGVTVGTDGKVTPIAPSNNTYVSLDGLLFKAA